MMARGMVTVCLGYLCLVCSTAWSAGGPVWMDSYGQAMKEAKQRKQMLLVYFHKDGATLEKDALCKKLANNAKLRPLLDNHVLVRIPMSHRAQVKGKQIALIRHSAFAELQGQAGIAVIDFENPKNRYYGHVVSIYPLSLPGALTSAHLHALLSLPEGTLTQRTLILAVRIHPEGPSSTDGTFLTALAAESESHSLYQARITNQGHHNWESRFHRISAEMPGGMLAQEVCAESWPGKGLIAAALDVVQSWRQSGGHWRAVRGRHRYYGYDMKRGPNGIWYATGIFSSR